MRTRVLLRRGRRSTSRSAWARRPDGRSRWRGTWPTRNGHRFGASGIYLRVARCGRKPLTVYATDHGSGGYAARVKVPKGGIRKLMVGLEGWRIIGDHEERADMFFPFDPPLVRRCSS